MSDVPLNQHALLSDCHSAALVTAAGSVDWLCLPRFDSAPMFARLLEADAGHFLVAPAGDGWSATWAYRPSTLVLDTVWTSSSGELVVTDTLALGAGESGHELGLHSPGVLLRRARCTRGLVSVRVEYVPRPEFGLIHPRLSYAHPGTRDGRCGIVADGGATLMLLSTQAHLELSGDRATGVLTLHRGEDLTFALQQGDPWGSSVAGWRSGRIRRRIGDTEITWRSWSQLHQSYSGPLRELVHQSGVVLQGLTYAASGAVIAAATTSLPEGIGSGRTWDYRYVWVRDASMTQQGLHVAACPEEAGRFFAFLCRAAAGQLDRGQDLPIMFGLAGERTLSEREIEHLSGWRDSGPVRVGNGAWRQCQLDVYGALLDAAYTLRGQLGRLEVATREFLAAAVERALSRWRDDDQGIWEMRGAPRPFLHSKLMCWVALDRGILLADQLRLDEDTLLRWRLARDEIHRSIVKLGWSEQAGAFSQSFGSDDLDASALLMVIVGFLPADDPRLLSTIDAVERELSDERGLVYRYRSPDGFDASEGTFLLCTFWLAHALALTGQLDRARRVLTRAAGQASDLGLLAEQVDPATGELLGNFPQAFSHLGLVNAAQALADAEARSAPPSAR